MFPESGIIFGLVFNTEKDFSSEFLVLWPVSPSTKGCYGNHCKQGGNNEPPYGLLLAKTGLWADTDICAV